MSTAVTTPRIPIDHAQLAALRLAAEVLQEHAVDSTDPEAMNDAAVQLDSIARATGAAERAFTATQINIALATSVRDIRDAAKLPESGVIDALNLLENATKARLAEPDVPLSTIAERFYDENLTSVLEWIDD